MKYQLFLAFAVSFHSVISKEDVIHRLHSIFKKPIAFPKRNLEKRDYSCCNLPSGDRGTCVPIPNCPVVQSWIHKRVVKYSDIHCSWNKAIHIVCCPPETIINLEDKKTKFDLCKPKYNFKECGSSSIYKDDLQRIYSMNETAEKHKKDGLTVVPTEVDVDKLVSFKVFNKTHTFRSPDTDVNEAVGGKDATRVATSYMALLGERDNRKIQWFCGGVIINRDWILTAAHCLVHTNKKNGNLDFLSMETAVIRLGEYDYSNDDITADENPIDFGIKEVILHPEYQYPIVYHDLALIKLNKSIPYHRPDMRPVCLPWEQEADRNLVGLQVTLTGWGVKTVDGELSSKPQEVNVTIFDTSICERSYASIDDIASKIPLGIYSDKMMCAGDSQGGKDACMGDSGGPIVYLDRSGKFTLAGIVSIGYGCGLATYPGIYVAANKAEYLSWIKQTAFSK